MFKVGDKVRVINAYVIDIELGITNGLVSEIVRITDDDICSDFYLKANPNRRMYLSQLAPLTKSIRDVVVGDTIESKSGDRAKVLAVCGEMIARSWSSSHKSFHSWLTFNSAESNWTIYQEPSDTIEVNGKKYSKDKLVERISDLETVE